MCADDELESVILERSTVASHVSLKGSNFRCLLLRNFEVLMTEQKRKCKLL